MTTYSQLRSYVETARGRNDIPAYVYVLASEEINRELRITEMESETTLSATGESVTLPTDFLEAKSLYIDATPRLILTPTTEATQMIRHDDSGRPAFYSLHNGELVLMPIPDGTYSLKLRYYARLDDLSDDTDTNDVLGNHLDIYLYAVLKHVAMWERKVEDAAAYGQMFMNAVGTAEQNDTKRRFGGGPIFRRPTISLAT